MKNKFPIVFISLNFLLLLIISAVLFLEHNGLEKSEFLLIPAVVIVLVCSAYAAIFSHNSLRRISKMNRNLESAAAEYMNSLSAPVAVLDESNQFVWYNQIFEEKISLGQDAYGHDFESFVSMNLAQLTEGGGSVCSVNGCIYAVTAEKFQKNDTSFLMIYFNDETNYHTLKKYAEESRQNVVIITIDNYDEIMQNAKESEKAQTSVETEKLIENFMNGTNGFIKKTSSNTFYAVIENRFLENIISEKFKILDAARNIKIAGKYQLTFSIGVGQNAENLAESETIARQCLDMALGRGGDQAVLKTENGYRFFGGVSKGVEKRSRAKTRIIANALQDLIMTSDKVFIMGHRFGDLDSIGAACGLAGALKLLNKEVFIAVDKTKNLAVNLIDYVDEQTNHRIFIAPNEAEGLITSNDLLIIVDTHNKLYVESKSLYEKSKSTVVIDHHRKTVNFIDDAVIFHHEPYASSASEMVAELIQYFKYDTDEKIESCCAEALLSGIMLDTKNFVMRTGVRTFEAAAYLKKIGADTVAVKLLFSNSIEAYRRKAQIVASATVHGDCAIAVADFKSDDIRIVAPQAADELLGISGVDASFVVFKTGSTINISGRSLGAINVQVIMEQLGGGGHQTMAATQIENITVQEAVSALTEVIDSYKK